MLDASDGKELSVNLQEARTEHIKEYGSMLHCPDRDTLCEYMNGAWLTGCTRGGCILDDPEHQRLQERIEENRRKNADVHRKEKEEERELKIRTQNKTEEELIMKRIQRLEEESARAYHHNRPALGEATLHEAIVLRRKLRRKSKERKDV